MQLRTRFALLAVAAGIGLLAGGVLGSPAGAAPGDTPQPGDPRATAHAGNVTTCAGAGLPGAEVTVGATVDATNTYVTITSVPAGVVLTGVVVKGGPAYNVYAGDQRTLLHAPLVSSGKPAQISHWFACGSPPGETTSPPATTTAPATSPPATTGVTPAPTSPLENPLPTSPAGQPGAALETGGLAETGGPIGTLVGLGALLLLGGVGLLAGPALRRALRAGPS